MTYELAKRLKDAGYPMPKPQPYQNAADENTIITPTLSELIEACGDGFLALSRSEDKWFANSKIKGVDIELGQEVFEGSTPEEAVAKLWLELNKSEGSAQSK